MSAVFSPLETGGYKIFSLRRLCTGSCSSQVVGTYSLTTNGGPRKKKFHMGILVNYYRPLTSEAVAKKNWIFSVLKNDFWGGSSDRGP